MHSVLHALVPVLHAMHDGQANERELPGAVVRARRHDHHAHAHAQQAGHQGA